MSILTNANFPQAYLPPVDRSDLVPHAHTIQFYDNDLFLLDDLSRFIGAALGAGDAAVVVATRSHRDALIRRLETSGFDVAYAATQGRFIMLDAADTLSRLLVDGQPDAGRFSALLGGAIARATSAVSSAKRKDGRVAAFGEMVALLWAEGKLDAAIQLEQLWNDLARTHSFDLRCAYPMSRFGRASDSAPIERIFAVHTHVIPSEGYTALAEEEERLRAIAFLQQKAQALETEIEDRKRIQKALAKREAELTDFLENALEGVQQVDAEQKIVWANKAVLRLLGYTAKEYVGHSLGEFMADKRVFKKLWRKLMRHEDIYDYPAELRCKDGSSKQILMHANGLWEGDRFEHARCFIHDVTEHKRMEQALRERNNDLREAVRARDSFFSVAAHELKTPITSLGGFAQLLLRNMERGREVPQERIEVALRVIESQSSKLSHLVTRLLDSTQIEAGKLRIEPSATDMAALVRSVLVQQQLEDSHKVVFKGPDCLQAVIDPMRFEQVITNLIDNAVKFSPEGGTVTVELAREACGDIRFSVTDQGMGIPVDEREAVFDRFHQAHKERHLSGMGLGLYITRQIVEMHGGRIRIEEPEPHGARFVVTLPVAVGSTRPEMQSTGGETRA